MNQPQSLSDKFGLKAPDKLDTNLPILVVEDQQDLRLIMVHHLQKLQFKTVIQAANGLQAVRSLKEHKNMSAILCDWDMPIMNGLHLIEELKSDPDLRRIPFCLMIENVSKEKIMLAVEHGVDDMLVKPLKLNDLIPKLRNAFKVFHNKNNPEPVYELAKKAISQKALEKAEKIYRELSIMSPNTARPLVGLARVALEKNDVQVANNFLEEAERNNANYIPIYTLKGQMDVASGQLDKALVHFKKAIDLSPLNPIRYQDCVDVLMKEKKYDEIQVVLEKGLKTGVQFPELYKYLSETYYNLKNFKSAIKYIKIALDAEPENIVFLNQLAICFKQSGDLAEAQKIYNKVIKVDPTNLQALYNKSLLLADTGQTPEAVKLLERITQRFPDFEKAKKKLAELKP